MKRIPRKQIARMFKFGLSMESVAIYHELPLQTIENVIRRWLRCGR